MRNQRHERGRIYQTVYDEESKSFKEVEVSELAATKQQSLPEPQPVVEKAVLLSLDWNAHGKTVGRPPLTLREKSDHSGQQDVPSARRAAK